MALFSFCCADVPVGRSDRDFALLQENGSRWKTLRSVRTVPEFLAIATIVLFPTQLVDGAAFTRVETPGLPPVASLASDSVAWADYDNDDDLDFLVTGSNYAQLWSNDNGSFSRIPIAGLPGIGDGTVAWQDYDNDGRLDFLVSGLTIQGNTTVIVSQLWRNTETGFQGIPVPGLPGVFLGDVDWGDFDNDGRSDFILTGTMSFNSGSRITQIWRNTGSGFVLYPVPGLPGLEGSSVDWGDYDSDGRLDFLLMGATSSIFSGTSPGAVTQLWRNTGNGFTLVSIPGLPAVFSGRAEWGDFDNDGRLDFMLTGESSAGKRTQLWRNTETGFTQVAIAGFAGNFGGTLAWADYNNDGWLDFLVSGGEGEAATQLWSNTSNGFLLDPVSNLTQSGVPSVAWGDYDKDGRIDFLITGFDGNQEPEDQYFSEIWRNAASISNQPPSAPSGLSATLQGEEVLLHWIAATDDHTPVSSLTYNLRLGTQSGAGNIINGQANPNNGFRRLQAPGNAGARTSAVLRLPPGNYHVRVQAVDANGVGGSFSPEISFSTLPRLKIKRQEGGISISWPQTSLVFELESRLADAPGTWAAESNAPELKDGEWSVSVPLPDASAAVIYRLKNQ